jgi:hypothetical protein
MAATPRSFSQWAILMTSVPHECDIRPPPEQSITAVPVALSALGRYMVMEGVTTPDMLWMFPSGPREMRSLSCTPSLPGAIPSYRRISCCANTPVASVSAKIDMIFLIELLLIGQKMVCSFAQRYVFFESDSETITVLFVIFEAQNDIGLKK